MPPEIFWNANLNHVGLVAHLPDLSHVPELLIDQRALEHDQHEEGEEGVVPVFVQAPQANAEHLIIGKQIKLVDGMKIS